MALWKWSLEKIVIATEVMSYMAEYEAENGRKISLEQAYSDKGVHAEMRLTKNEIKEIISSILA